MPDRVFLASELSRRLQFSGRNSLIAESRLDAGCITLYSEDMPHGQAIDGRLTILNPFAGGP